MPHWLHRCLIYKVSRYANAGDNRDSLLACFNFTRLLPWFVLFFRLRLEGYISGNSLTLLTSDATAGPAYSPVTERDSVILILISGLLLYAVTCCLLIVVNNLHRLVAPPQR